MGRAVWIVALIVLGAMVFFFARTTNDSKDKRPAPPPVPSPVAEPEEHVESLQCPKCDGYGYVIQERKLGSVRRICEFCDGKGGKVLRIPPGNIKCPDCEGFGRIGTATDYEVCRRCDGRGYVKAPFQPVP